MLLSALFRSLPRRSHRTPEGRHRQKLPHPRRFLPGLEVLEGRTVPSTFTVSNLASSGPGSLPAAVLAADSTPGANVIQFAPGLHGTIPLAAQLSLTGDLTIKGPSAQHLTVSGSGVTRVFDIGGDATVTLAGLTIADGSFTGNDAPGTPITSYGGGGILNEVGSTLTLNRDVLTNNTATASSETVDIFGGGLLNEGSATVNNCSFSGNQTTGGGGSSFFGGSCGGALENYGGATLTVTNSSFSANQSLGSTGGYAMAGALGNDAGLNQNLPSKATLSNCTFTDNTAGGVAGSTDVYAQGGALDNQGPGSTMTVSNCTFLDNQAVGGSGAFGTGGGIINTGGYLYPATTLLTVTNCSFTGNQAIGGGGAAENALGQGGAIFNITWEYPTITPETTLISNCTFTDNTARGVAGVSDSSGAGGALNNAGPASTMIVSNSIFLGNQAVGGNAGAIDNNTGAMLTVTNSLFRGNQALGTAYGISDQAYGGAIVNQAAFLPTTLVTATITDCTFIGNVATGSAGADGGGGALYNVGLDAIMTVSNSTLVGNEAVGGAGGVGVNGGDGVGGGIDNAGILMLSCSTLEFNSAQGGKGGVGADGGDGLGGGLATQTGSSSTVSNSVITGNEAEGGLKGSGGSNGQGVGGGVYNLGSFADALTVILGNKATTRNDNFYP